MSLFRRRRDSVQLKADTRGTSNEISLSVLDATKDALDDESQGRSSNRGVQRPRLGVIRLFTIAGRKRSVATPKKDKAILLEEDLVGEGEGAPERSAASRKGGKGAAGKHARETIAAETPSTAIGWESSSALVSARKHRRLRGRRILIVVCCLFAATLVAVGVGFAVNYFTTQETLRGQLETVINRIDRADEALIPLDDLVAAEASTGAATPETTEQDADADGAGNAEADYDALKPKLADARDLLNRARDDIDEFKASIGDARDYEVANEAVKAIDARLEMIELGESIMDTSLDLRAAQRLAADGWDALLAADDDAREAAALASDTSQDNARLAIERSQAAIEALTTSANAIAQAQTLAPDVDLSAYGSYINLRIEALQAAVAADEAYLARNKEAAAEQNDRYNELDAQAAATTDGVSVNPAELIGASLVERIKPDVEAYGAQRQEAGGADGLLRTFLDHRT